MPGFTPTEGLNLKANMFWKRSLGDRDATLELMLITNVAPGMSTAYASLTEPTGTGYSRKTLTDSSWSGPSAGAVGYAVQEFEAGSGGWSGNIQGYAVVSVSSGGTRRILGIEIDANGPYVLNEGDTYRVTLAMTEMTENEP